MMAMMNAAAMPATDTTDATTNQSLQQRLRAGFTMRELREHSPVFRKLGRGPWAVFRVIVDHLEDRPEAWPSMPRIARHAGYASERSVSAFVRELAARGILCLRRVHRADGTERLYYSLGPKAFAELNTFATRWPRADRKAGPTIADAKPRPPPAASVAPPPAIAAAPPPATIAGEPRSPDLREPSSFTLEDLAIGKGTAKEEIDRILLVETTRARADEDAAVLQVLVDQLHVTTPDIVLFAAPTLANFAAVEVALVREALRLADGDTSRLTAASRGATLPGRSKGEPTIRFIFSTMKHWLGHEKAWRVAERKRARAETVRVAEQARAATFATPTAPAGIVASRAPGGRADGPDEAMRAAARERARNGLEFFDSSARGRSAAA